MSGYSIALRDSILNWLRGTVFPTVPATLYVALLTTNPSDDTGTGLVEVSTGTWTNYARQPVASSTSGWSAPSGSASPQAISNAALIDFGNASMSPASAQVTVVGFALYTAVTAGTFEMWAPLTNNKVISNTDDISFAIGSLVIDQ